MDKKYKQLGLLGIILIAAYVALTNFDAFSGIFSGILKIALPVVIGLLTAFIINVPICGFENKLTKLCKLLKIKPNETAIHIISLVLTLLVVILLFVLLVSLLIPELIKTVSGIIKTVEASLPGWLKWLESKNINTASIKALSKNLDMQKLLDTVTGQAGNMLSSVTTFASSTISSLSAFVLGVIIAIYAQLSRKNLTRQAKKVVYAFFKNEIAEKILRFAILTNNSYKRFLSIQCLEAVILGVMIFVSFLIFGIPYAALIGVVTAVCALVPYVGAFISCAVAVLLSLLVSPEKALICLIVYLVVQFIESQFIYPHVVGGSVGLSPLWTLVAVLIGGNLFGVLGMIFFIPLVAVIYELFREYTNKKIEEKSAENEQLSELKD